MKKYIVLIALIAISATTFGQARGTYGTLQANTPAAGTLFKYVAGVITPVASGKLDTLVNADTGLVRWTFNNLYQQNFDYTVTKVTGTVGGTAILQGSNDNSTWYTIVGDTSTCGTCIGAKATITNTAGTKHYVWILPVYKTNFKYWQVQYISTGTMTASYNGITYYAY